MTKLSRLYISGLALLFALSPWIVGCTSTPAAKAPIAAAPAAALTDAQRAANVASFDKVWTTIHDEHWDPTLGGVDWDKARAELRPKVEQAKSAEEARHAISDLISRLHQSHFGIIPAEFYEHVGSPKPGDPPAGDGEIGASVRIVDNRAMITAVRSGSPAEAAGVHPGWILTAINGRAVDDILLPSAGSANIASTLRPALLSRAVEARLFGPVGSPVQLDLLDGKDHPVTKSPIRAEPAGNPSKFGNLPTFHVTYDQRRIDLDVGYIAFGAFLDMPGVLAKFNAAIPQFADTRGLIIDLRGNPGGIGAMAMAIGGWFVTKPDQFLGTMRTRDLTFKFVLNPRLVPYTKPVAVLIDECSLSTSEILAGGLQSIGRARVFGMRSGGAALPSTIERLPNGDGFQYAFADYITASGQVLEAKGVTPDVIVPHDRDALLAGRDPVIDAAVEWIRSSPKQ